MRRLYQVLRNNMAALVLWLTILIALSLVESAQIKADFWHSYFFIVAQMPLQGLVLFGSYALCSMGYHLMILEDCNDAHAELVKEIEMAKSDLKKKGLKL